MIMKKLESKCLLNQTISSVRKIIYYICSVKKRIIISNVILLTAIYCFTIGFGVKSFVYFDSQNTQNTRTSEQEKYYTPSFTSLFCVSTQFEGSENTFNDFPTTSFNNLFNELWALAKRTDQFYKSAFTQYVHFSGNLLIRYRKTNIIFPFNCFW